MNSSAFGSVTGKRSSLGASPVAKRLKQARLPFQVITPIKSSSSLTEKEVHAASEHSSVKLKKLSENVILEDCNESSQKCKENMQPRKIVDCEDEATNCYVKLYKCDKLIDANSKCNCANVEVLVDVNDGLYVQNSDVDADFMAKLLPEVIIITDDETGEANRLNNNSVIDDFNMAASSHINSSSDVDILKTIKINDTMGKCLSDGQSSIKVNTFVDSINIPLVSLEKDCAETKNESKSRFPVKKKIKIHRKSDPVKYLEMAKKQEQEQMIKEEKLKLKEELLQQKKEMFEQRQLQKEKKQMEKQERKNLEEKRKQEKQRQKEEEKKKKQEVLNAIVEEKQRKKEEEQRKKDKVKTAFASFFVKRDLFQDVCRVVHNSYQKPKNLGIFLPFQIKENMRLAPLHRNKNSNSSYLVQKLDVYLDTQSSETYLNELNLKKTVPCESEGTWPVGDKDIEICVQSSLTCPKKAFLRPKLLQFQENERPPYWGTWQKSSAVIRPRRPFIKDAKFFNYDMDSDEEWEEEEPGESLSHSEDDKESEDDYDVDNEFFVPHGYLSDEEAQDEDKPVSPETLKVQLKIKEQEFEKDRKRKFKLIKPVVIGCVWMDDVSSEASKALEKYAAVFIEQSPIPTQFSRRKIESSVYEKQKSNVDSTGLIKYTPNKCCRKMPEEAMPYFIQLVHGNQHNSKIIFTEFLEFWKWHTEKDNMDKLNSLNANIDDFPQTLDSGSIQLKLSKVLLKSTLHKIASWCRLSESGPYKNKFGWLVNLEYRERYNLQGIVLPNQWNYCTKVAVLRTPEQNTTSMSSGSLANFLVKSSPQSSIISATENTNDNIHVEILE